MISSTSKVWVQHLSPYSSCGWVALQRSILFPQLNTVILFWRGLFEGECWATVVLLLIWDIRGVTTLCCLCLCVCVCTGTETSPVCAVIWEVHECVLVKRRGSQMSFLCCNTSSAWLSVHGQFTHIIVRSVFVLHKGKWDMRGGSLWMRIGFLLRGRSHGDCSCVHNQLDSVWWNGTECRCLQN